MLDLPEARFGSSSDLREPGVAADRQRAATDDLHPGVLLRVVRRSDADAAVEGELGNRVVEHLRPHEPELDDLGACVGEAVHDSREDGRRRQAHVVPDGGAAGLEMLRVRARHAVRAVLVELARVDPANVVRLEDGGVEHGGMLVAPAIVSTIQPWSASSQPFCSSISSTQRVW